MNIKLDFTLNTSSEAPSTHASGRDVFGKTPIHGPLWIFKSLYYVASLFNFRRTLKAWQMRKHNIQVVDEPGTAVN